MTAMGRHADYVDHSESDMEQVTTLDELTEAVEATDTAQEAAPSEDAGEGDVIDLKVQIRPDTVKKLKILAILASPSVVKELKDQLATQVNEAFDRLISEEMLQQMKSAGMIHEDAGTAPGTKNSKVDPTSHELSEDEAEEESLSLEEQAERDRTRGAITPAAALAAPVPQFKDVDEDADAYLDQMFQSVAAPQNQDAARRRASEDERLARAAGFMHTAGVTKAARAFDSARPKAAVSSFDGDEDGSF